LEKKPVWQKGGSKTGEGKKNLKKVTSITREENCWGTVKWEGGKEEKDEWGKQNGEISGGFVSRSEGETCKQKR